MFPGLFNLLFLVTPFNTPPALWRYFTEVDRRPRVFAWSAMSLVTLGIIFQILFRVVDVPARSNASGEWIFAIGLFLLLAGGSLLVTLKHLVARRLHRYLSELAGDYCVWCGGISTAQANRPICRECTTIIPPERKPLIYIPNVVDLMLGIRWQSISSGAWKYLLAMNRVAAGCLWLSRVLFLLAAISIFIDVLSGLFGLNASTDVVVHGFFSASVLAGICLAIAGRECGVHSLRRYLARYDYSVCTQCATPMHGQQTECVHCGYAFRKGEHGLKWMILHVNDAGNGLRPSGIF